MMHPSRIKKPQIALMVALAAASWPAIPGQAGEGGLGVPGIAEREIARRSARIEDARQAMERGDELFAQGRYEDALAQYRSAKDTLDQLPNAPFIQDWRDLANLKFADCAVVVAREKAKVGDYVASRKLLEEAQAAVPGHKTAIAFAKQLDDPDRWPPAFTPQHVENVAKVTQQLTLANSSKEIGNYDNALEQYEEVLRIDPYNIAARRGMEQVEHERSQYFLSARDHQRSRMLNMVNEAWEYKPPVRGLKVDALQTGGQEPTVYINRKMQELVFPQIQFSGASIEEAVEFLRVKSKDIDVNEPDPAKKGINIILKAGDAPITASISLDLRDVPMVEALRYVTELAGMKYKVEPYAVLIVPISDISDTQYTRIYRVRPDFLSLGGSEASAAPAANADPFASTNAAAPASGLLQRKTALEILKAQGIPFPDGSSAVFNPVTSQLIVKNTQPNLDLVEAFVDAIKTDAPKQIYITSKFIEVSQKNTDELGFDWLLGAWGGDVAVSGGSDGNSGLTTGDGANDVRYPLTIDPTILAPMSRGLRTGTRAITGNAIDATIANGISGQIGSTEAPGVFSVAGVLTDPQFGVVIRALAQRKGVDLMSAPSVTTKGGQRATIEVIREFIYPTEFDPPQVPTNVGGNIGGGAGGGGGGSIPVTPTTPTAFEMRPVGVRMEVDPTVGADGYTIDLNLLPEVTEFDGFINYGSPIFSSGTTNLLDAAGNVIFDFFGNPITRSERILLTENIINQPVFSTRKVTTSVTVWDGQTVVLGGLIREDVQDIEDKIPVLGDLPFVGRLFKSKAEDHFKRNLMIFVTAKLIDPAGQPINANLQAQGDAGSTGPSSELLPPVMGN